MLGCDIFIIFYHYKCFTCLSHSVTQQLKKKKKLDFGMVQQSMVWFCVGTSIHEEHKNRRRLQCLGHKSVYKENK